MRFHHAKQASLKKRTVIHILIVQLCGGIPNKGMLLSNEEVYGIISTTNMEDTIAHIAKGNKSNLRFCYQQNPKCNA